jgi:hypothetical protein
MRGATKKAPPTISGASLFDRIGRGLYPIALASSSGAVHSMPKASATAG